MKFWFHTNNSKVQLDSALIRWNPRKKCVLFHIFTYCYNRYEGKKNIIWQHSPIFLLEYAPSSINHDWLLPIFLLFCLASTFIPNLILFILILISISVTIFILWYPYKTTNVSWTWIKDLIPFKSIHSTCHVNYSSFQWTLSRLEWTNWVLNFFRTLDVAVVFGEPRTTHKRQWQVKLRLRLLGKGQRAK